MADRLPGRDAVTHWARHATAVRTLREVVRACNTAGVRVLPVKGVLTAHLLYDDVAERPMSDIDVRIARNDYRRLLLLARARGWRPRIDSPRLWEAVLSLDEWTVDVECTLGAPGLCAISIADLLGRATTIVGPLGFEHLEPEIHDHALLLALGAFKDGLRSVPWARQDLLRIVRHRSFDARALVDRAREGCVLTALWVVADWLAREHDAAGWFDVRSNIGRTAPSRRVALAYEALLSHWSPKLGHLLTASASDDPKRAALGLAMAGAGVLRGRMNRRREVAHESRTVK